MVILRYKSLSALVLGVVLGAASPVLGDTHTVYPSGDTSGVTDHATIQSAMESISPGDTVALAEGHFYINAGIVVEGFNGTLRGATRGQNVLTVLEAVAPFNYSYATNYYGELLSPPGWDARVMPSVLYFDFPAGEITVQDLVFQALAPAYVEGRPGHSALDHFIADFGGDVDVTYKNLMFIAGVGDYAGSNVRMAIHSMRGPACATLCNRRLDPAFQGVGDAVISQIRSVNVADYVVAPMFYRDGSLKIEDISANKGVSVSPYGMTNMNVTISGVDSTGSWRAMWLDSISGGKTTVSEVTADGPVCPLIMVRFADNIQIRDSWLSGCHGWDVWWRAPIFIARDTQNVTVVGSAIVDVTGIVSAITVHPVGTDRIVIRDNYYDPSIFVGPPGPWALVLGSSNSVVVEPSLMPHQVLDLGLNNSIKLGDH